MLHNNYNKTISFTEKTFLMNGISKDYFTQEQKSQIERNLKHKSCQRNEVIFREGHPAFRVYFIKSGIIKLWKEGVNFVEQTIRFAKEGDMIGFWGSYENNNYSLSATAITDIEISYIEKDFFMPVVQDSPSLQIIFHDYIKELKKTEDDLRNMAEMNVREKVAHSILVLLHVFKDLKDDHTYKAVLSRKAIASLSAVSEDRVSKQLSEFKKENIIGQDDDRMHIDQTALKEITKSFPWYNSPLLSFSLVIETHFPFFAEFHHLLYWNILNTSFL